MTILEMIKANGAGKSDEIMWSTIERISSYVDEHKDDNPEEYEHLMKHLHADIIGEHFNEECGREQIEKMWYKDKSGNEHYAPYWTDEQMENVYANVKNMIPDCYTEWDFYVALNMLKSDYYNLFVSWFGEDNVDSKVVEMTVSYFNDCDAPHPKSKIWSYFF